MTSLNELQRWIDDHPDDPHAAYCREQIAVIRAHIDLPDHVCPLCYFDKRQEAV